MDPKAIVIAKSRLRVATQALDDLRNCTKYDDFFDRWFIFLAAWKGIYTTLEQGAKASPQSRQWFGAKKEERKKDPLLQYLFQARNDEEHGLAQSVAPSEGQALYAIPDAGVENRKLRLEVDTLTGKQRLLRDDGGPIELIQEHPPGPALQTVKGRDKDQYAPPMAHLGQTIDMTPIGVATAGLGYMVALISEAERLCKPSP